MERQGLSKIAFWCVGVAALSLSGCVINPYVKDGRLSRMNRDRHDCQEATAIKMAGTIDSAKAYTYAECVRIAMANKAGKYAWMNNAGAVTLIQMAGFAGYSGIRGGHNAQVAAFTTAGASGYGAQQYLYRKPREAIYWSGSQAIGCAVGTARNKSLLKDQLAALPDIAASADAVERARRDERLAEEKLGDLDACDRSDDGFDEVQSIRNAVSAALWEEMTFDARTTEFTAEKGRWMVAAIAASASAARDLVTATDAIREVVNAQLSREQPDPAELSKLLATLKLPSLSGSTGVGVPAAAPPPTPNAGHPLAGAPPPPRGESVCELNWSFLSEYEDAANAYISAVAAHQRNLADAEARLDAIEQAEAKSGGIGSKPCTVGLANALLPFGLTFAQEGVQKVSAGKTLAIPITGGVPPYAITFVSSSGGAIPVVARQRDDGGFEVAVGGASTVKGAKATFFVNDDVGAGKSVSAEVTD